MNPIEICIIFAIIIAGVILMAGKQGKTIRQQQKTIEYQKIQLAASARINQMIHDIENKKIICTMEEIEKCMNVRLSSLPPTVQEKYIKEILKIA